MPWPKAMVIVFSMPQCLGISGSADSGSSVRSRVSWPIERRKFWWPSMPTIMAIFAAPMFEE